MNRPAGRAADTFAREVSGRFGFLPNFFRTAPAAPELIKEMWRFARSAYIDSPLPSVFKERLFVHLSRFSEARYCIVRHVGFLIGEGNPAGDPDAEPQSVEAALALLRRPIPGATGIGQALRQLEAHPGPIEIPAAGTRAETDLFDVLATIFLQPLGSNRAVRAVRRVVGDGAVEILTGFLAFVRTAHFWTETHSDVDFEPDMIVVMQRHKELARLLLDPSDARSARPGGTFHSALAELDGARAALRDSEARLQALVAAIPQLVWRAAKDGRRIWTSPQWAAHTGFGEAESREFGWLQAVHPDDLDRVVKAWEAACDAGKFDIEYRIASVGEGRHRRFRARATPIRGDDGHIVEWLGISTDVDQSRRSNKS